MLENAEEDDPFGFSDDEEEDNDDSNSDSFVVDDDWETASENSTSSSVDMVEDDDLAREINFNLDIVESGLKITEEDISKKNYQSCSKFNEILEQLISICVRCG